MHEQSDLLKISQALARKVLELKASCERQDEDEIVRCYRLDDCAELARLITADLGDYD